MAIKIYKKVFLLIHDTLYGKFKDLVDPQGLRKWRVNDRSAWDACYPNTEIKIFPDVFSGRIHVWYWNEKRSSHRTSKDGFLYEPSSRMIEAFSYLGCELPDFISDFLDDNIDVEARVLLQVFLEKSKKGKRLLETYSDLKVFDTEKQLLNFTDIKQDEKHINGAPEITNSEFQYNSHKNQISEKNSSNELITDLIMAYYNHISSKKFYLARMLLTNELRQKLEGNATQIRGFVWTESISNIHIWDIGYNSTEANCKVYFEENVFIDRLRTDISPLVHKNNLDWVSRWIPLMQTWGRLPQLYMPVMDSKTLDTLNWELELITKKSRIPSDPPEREGLYYYTKPFTRVYKFSLKKIEGKWLIAEITSAMLVD